MTTDKQSYPTDLNDDQWQLIADLLPPPEPFGRKPTVDLRSVVNAIFYILVSVLRLASATP